MAFELSWSEWIWVKHIEHGVFSLVNGLIIISKIIITIIIIFIIVIIIIIIIIVIIIFNCWK